MREGPCGVTQAGKVEPGLQHLREEALQALGLGVGKEALSKRPTVLRNCRAVVPVLAVTVLPCTADASASAVVGTSVSAARKATSVPVRRPPRRCLRGLW